jgi:hypothetical protein
MFLREVCPLPGSLFDQSLTALLSLLYPCHLSLHLGFEILGLGLLLR